MFPEIEFDEVPLDRQWRRLEMPAGAEVRGWKCGPVVPAIVHWNGEASKPCRHEMSSGALFCNCQKVKVAKRKLGYIPILHQNGERVVIILSNTVAARAKKLLHGDPIKLSRPTTPKAPIKIEPWPSYEVSAETTKRVRKYVPCDIQAWLLRLWGDPLLTRYYAEKALAVSDETTPADPTQTPMPFAVMAPKFHSKNSNIVDPE